MENSLYVASNEGFVAMFEISTGQIKHRLESPTSLSLTSMSVVDKCVYVSATTPPALQYQEPEHIEQEILQYARLVCSKEIAQFDSPQFFTEGPNATSTADGEAYDKVIEGTNTFFMAVPQRRAAIIMKNAFPKTKRQPEKNFMQVFDTFVDKATKVLNYAMHQFLSVVIQENIDNKKKLYAVRECQACLISFYDMAKKFTKIKELEDETLKAIKNFSISCIRRRLTFERSLKSFYAESCKENNSVEMRDLVSKSKLLITPIDIDTKYQFEARNIQDLSPIDPSKLDDVWSQSNYHKELARMVLRNLKKSGFMFTGKTEPDDVILPLRSCFIELRKNKVADADMTESYITLLAELSEIISRVFGVHKYDPRDIWKPYLELSLLQDTVLEIDANDLTLLKKITRNVKVRKYAETLLLKGNKGSDDYVYPLQMLKKKRAEDLLEPICDVCVTLHEECKKIKGDIADWANGKKQSKNVTSLLADIKKHEEDLGVSGFITHALKNVYRATKKSDPKSFSDILDETSQQQRKRKSAKFVDTPDKQETTPNEQQQRKRSNFVDTPDKQETTPNEQQQRKRAKDVDMPGK